MNKLIIKLKYKPLLKRFSLTKRKKFVFKFDKTLTSNIDFFNINAFFDKNGLLNVVVLQNNIEFEKFYLTENDYHIFKPNIKDLFVEFNFILKNKN